MKSILIVFLFFAGCLNLCGQYKLLSGPMLGHIDMREASVWVQASSSQPVILTYWPEKNMKDLKKIELKPDSLFGNTATFYLTDLEPATTYKYIVGSNTIPYSLTTQALWQYRTDPPPFKVALGSCVFINEEQYDRPGNPYGGDYQIFSSILATKPDLMLWGGDNVYLREVDFNSRSGIIHRYSDMRDTPELKNLLSSCANYAIWDDHDFGPNDGNGSYIHKDWTLDAFKHFWANPSYGLPGEEEGEGITTQFSWSDIDFFLLDNRYYRVAPNVNGQGCTFLGKKQIDWLIQSLKFSKAPFKLVVMGGQFLNTYAGYETYATCPTERQTILDLIESNNIKGVVFITGDRHFTELSKLALDTGVDIYDLTVSPLTSSPYTSSKEENTLRVDRTMVTQRNFATLGFSGKKGERTMTISVYNSEGDMVWIKSIFQVPEK
ncbi:MAG: alkaline phosphatase D family protein [Crocinitomicaceae bacterium]|nr:alkaline phosphatase D family protein [Crocinitomicaceae bacterium]